MTLDLLFATDFTRLTQSGTLLYSFSERHKSSQTIVSKKLDGGLCQELGVFGLWGGRAGILGLTGAIMGGETKGCGAASV